MTAANEILTTNEMLTVGAVIGMTVVAVGSLARRLVRLRRKNPRELRLPRVQSSS